MGMGILARPTYFEYTPAVGEIAALSAAAAWAVASLMFTRLGARVPPVALNLAKCVIALVLLSATGVALGADLPGAELDRRDLTMLAVSGLVGLTIGDSLYFGALLALGPRRALLLWALTPPATVLLGWVFLGEHLVAGQIAGIALTLAGVIWVIVERTHTTARKARIRSRTGILLGVGAAVCQAVGNLLTKAGGGDLPALEISVVRLAFGAAGLLVVAGAMGQLRTVAPVVKSPRLAGGVFVATLIGTYLGLWLSMAGLRYAEIGVASTLSCTSPIFVLPLAYFVSKERVSARAAAGALIAVLGIGLIFLS